MTYDALISRAVFFYNSAFAGVVTQSKVRIVRQRDSKNVLILYTISNTSSFTYSMVIWFAREQ